MYVHYPALELFYTTSIMTAKVNRAILRYRDYEKRIARIPERKKDMMTINCLYYLDSERQTALLCKEEKGFDLVHSFKVRVKRLDCILEPGVN